VAAQLVASQEGLSSMSERVSDGFIEIAYILILGLNGKAVGTCTKGLVRVRMKDDLLMRMSSLDIVMKGWCD
jgi:hypothetical protein